jgi:GT2 family glycosyltransferase/MoaA/NifB/PqqE/SkfB family radical SAM enzyme
MAVDLYLKILSELAGAEVIRLNYSGESTHYPQFASALRAAARTGAAVELVSALSSAPESVIRSMVDDGLDRLSVSVHTLDDAQYRRMYKASSVSALLDRLRLLRDYQRQKRKNTPVLSFSFVAIHENIGQLPSVCALAREFGVDELTVHPVIRREPTLVHLNSETDLAGDLRPDFAERISAAVSRARCSAPGLRVKVARPALAPRRHSPGFALATCEQNPWETSHILANGDVVVCEVQDKSPLGNLASESFRDLWQGDRYRRVRTSYLHATLPACRSCPWLERIDRDGWNAGFNSFGPLNAQFIRGWYAKENEQVVWSRQSAVLVLRKPPSSDMLAVSGLLPPNQSGREPNSLTIRCNGDVFATVENRGPEMLSFEVRNNIGHADGIAVLEFETAMRFLPRETGSVDVRELGFALVEAVAEQSPRPARTRTRNPGPFLSPASDWKPGLSVLIPERGNPELLASCLTSLERALLSLAEPSQIVVVVNGSSPADYSFLRQAHPTAEFVFYPRAMGFSKTVCRGMRRIRHDWVYLLNNDVTLEPDAIAEIIKCRSADVFAVGSRIALCNNNGGQEETNYTQLVIDKGRVDIWDVKPPADDICRPCFYCGGGSSLFRTGLLKYFASKTLCYDPFYWEDAEWGAIARLHGYECLFCPRSRVHHRRRATVAKFYETAEVDRIFARNRLLFELRNVASSGGLRALLRRIWSEGGRTRRELLFTARIISALLARRRGTLDPKTFGI